MIMGSQMIKIYMTFQTVGEWKFSLKKEETECCAFYLYAACTKCLYNYYYYTKLNNAYI